ncbi:dTMP kinase [Haploplasma modicum]|uniref:dTMP kinase n=1 Tax=Haploplasma modicum TaxID=2150 RepID=UPI001B3890D4|nr:dTMP kinase [Haploplasma modicum]MCR1808649.1 dTMP kinase [Haploplasma modicum]
MFITFEGGEGTGKTTLIALVKKELESKGYNVILTREPGGSGSLFAESIRQLVLDPKYTNVNPYTEALLYAASRAQHLDEVILPALKNKTIVLCDRYLDSSLAYQAFARELGLDFILNINKYALDHLPNLTFYIDLDPEIGLKRIKGRDKIDRLDQEKLTFHQKVRSGYLEVAKKFDDRIMTIDGDQSIDNIAKIMLDSIMSKI